MDRKQKCFLIVLLCLFFTLWEGYCRVYSHSLRFILPAPSVVFSELISRPHLFVMHALATLKVMGGGVFFASLVAFPIAWLMSKKQSVSLLLQGVFVFLQCIPIFTLAPLMILLFGWSYSALVVPTALMIFFPLTLNIAKGLNTVPQDFVDYFKANKATEFQLLTKLRLPWALPQIFAGFRISIGVAGVGAIAGEWAGAQRGLGVLILESRRSVDLQTTFGAIFLLIGISLTAYGLAVILENWITQQMKRGAICSAIKR